MLTTLLTTVPFFALVLCGYVATRAGWLPAVSIPGLNTFVLYFALPCLLFRFGATTPVLQYLHPAIVGVYLLCAALLVALVVLGTLRRHGWNDAAFGALVAIFPNTGYMGVPLLVVLLGTRAAGPAIVTILVDLLFTSSLCVALSRLGATEAHGARTALANAARGVVVNPLPWAIVLGLVAADRNLVLPKPAFETVGLLADAASPVALFTIGAVLARSQASASARTPLREVVPLAFVKLVVHPALVWTIGRVAIAIGVPLDAFAASVLVLVAALPSASNVAMLAERFGADNGRVTRIILLSTALAFLSFSAAFALVT